MPLVTSTLATLKQDLAAAPVQPVYVVFMGDESLCPADGLKEVVQRVFGGPDTYTLDIMVSLDDLDDPRWAWPVDAWGVNGVPQFFRYEDDRPSTLYVADDGDYDADRGGSDSDEDRGEWDPRATLLADMPEELARFVQGRHAYEEYLVGKLKDRYVDPSTRWDWWVEDYQQWQAEARAAADKDRRRDKVRAEQARVRNGKVDK